MIDILIVVSYLVLLLAFGVWQRSKNQDFSDFSKVQGKYTKKRLLIVATIFVSSIGGGTTFGISEKVFGENIAYSYGLMLAIPVDILIAIYLIPRLAKHHGAETVGDIMAKYYGITGKYITGLSTILVSLGLLAAQISVSGRIFQYILNIDYFWSVVLSYSIIVIYTTIGGLRSVLFANQLQFFAIIISIPLISIFGLHEIGFNEFAAKLPMHKISFLANDSLLYETIAATLGFMVINLLPTFIQRSLINKDSAITSNAIYIKSFIYIIFLMFVTLNGLLAYVNQPDIDPSLALPFLIDHIIPAGIQGVVVVGLLSAVMSTADSDLNVISITLVKDVINPVFSVSNRSIMLFLAKITNIVVGIGAIYISLHFERVVDLVIFMSGFWGAVILCPLILGLFDIKIPVKGFVFSCTMGLVSFLLWEYYAASKYILKGVFVGFVINCLLFFAFYLKKVIKRSVFL